MTVMIRAFRDGYRRGGMAHTTSFKTYPDDFFTDEQLDQLMDDPMIVMEHVRDGGTLSKPEELKEHPGTGEPMIPVPGQTLTEPGPPIEPADGEMATAVAGEGVALPEPDPDLPELPQPDPDEEARARDTLTDMTVPQLKKECDGIGLEYPKNARKDDLIGLLITNTAVAPVDEAPRDKE